ncbi:MAG: 4-hydroxy-tetrahydrodipicolinate synthase [Candidatus Nanohaloarchaea archaeon]|nr:4-hydroxy-tetrahydrodipicolinate synthase [Candidatus Nanohaloarchaea archaeon]
MLISGFELRGVYPALPTPVQDGEINYEALANHIDYLEDGGVHGIVPAGCTGHAASLEEDERVELIRRAAAMTDLPVIAGTGQNSTRQTLQLARRVEETADVVAHLMISPYQNKPEQEGIVRHYEQLTEKLEKPIIAYNVPSRTGRNIEASTALELAAIPGVMGIKEASLDYEQIREIGRRVQLQDHDFVLGSGDDAANDYVFEQGGAFAISVTANVAPDLVVEVWEEAVEQGNHQRAYERNLELRDLHDAMFLETNPIPVMEALNQLGFDAGTPREPLDQRPSPENRQQISDVLERYGLS